MKKFFLVFFIIIIVALSITMFIPRNRSVILKPKDEEFIFNLSWNDEEHLTSIGFEELAEDTYVLHYGEKDCNTIAVYIQDEEYDSKIKVIDEYISGNFIDFILSKNCEVARKAYIDYKNATVIINESCGVYSKDYPKFVEVLKTVAQ